MISRVIAIAAGVLCALVAARTIAQQIENVEVDPRSFDPSRGQATSIRYDLDRGTRVTIRLYDPDGGLVRTLIATRLQDAGSQRIAWDGRDEEGRIVPNEAYTFTIEPDSGEIYDPTAFSGGLVDDVTDVEFQADGTLLYSLPQDSRVLIRLGIRNGPMLKTLVDWKPRSAGRIREPWNGHDENDLVDLRGVSGFSALVTYVTLPAATAIAFGNDEESYRDYKLGRGKAHPVKPKRAVSPPRPGQLRPEYLVPPAWQRAPRVSLEFRDPIETNDRGLPIVRQMVRSQIDVDPSDKPALAEDQFEVIMFVDNEILAEAERGFLPLTWRWDLSHLEPGEHILTVNISSFRGQVGVASRKIELVK